MSNSVYAVNTYVKSCQPSWAITLYLPRSVSMPQTALVINVKVCVQLNGILHKFISNLVELGQIKQKSTCPFPGCVMPSSSKTTNKTIQDDRKYESGDVDYGFT